MEKYLWVVLFLKIVTSFVLLRPFGNDKFIITACFHSVQGLLPRGEKPNSLREKHFEINHGLQDLIPSIPNAFYIDADPGFVKSDGAILAEDMYDYLHLTRRGYKKFCKPIYDMVMRFIKYS